MKPHHQITANSAWLYRLFTLGPSRVLLTGETIHIEQSPGDVRVKIPVVAISSITVLRSWFWRRLMIRQSDGIKRSIGGLDQREAELIRDAALEEAARIHKLAEAEAVKRAEEAERIRKLAEAEAIKRAEEAERIRKLAEAEAIKRARALSPRLTQLDEELRQLFAGDHYVRYHNSLTRHEAIAPILRECEDFTRKYLEREAKEALGRLEHLEPVENFEAERKKANCLFVCTNVPAVKDATLSALSKPLTKEQAEAIATDEDATLVLAGAGTGKTSVIVGKVTHLVRNQGVSPSEVLVLAFNRKAAAEIRERLKGDLSAAHVHTFHSFGRRVIAESKVAPTISKLAEDDLTLKRAVDAIIGELLNDLEQSKAVIDFIIYHHAPYRSAFEFDTPYEYEEYVREVELRTLSGNLVKSFEELAIANYLTEYGIEFEYERRYEHETATRDHSQYQPDFFLPAYGIYIEHFALNEQGCPPPGWRGYAEGVEWKRTIHCQQGSTLVETHSWQHQQGVLLKTLRSRLEEAGVSFAQVPRQTLVRQLAQEQTSWLAGLLATFLNHVKSGSLSPDAVRALAHESGDRRRNESFLAVFEQVRDRYQKRLADEGALDFHDLINLAAEHIREGRWKPQYRYVLVDEFQDISAGRMALLQALHGQDIAYFLVGDDWQSIYRFAGSDVALLRDCGDRLGHVEERTLSKTFRFAGGILSPSTAFVKRNPEQTQRPLLPASGADDEGVTIVADPSPAGGVARALQDIEARTRTQPCSVLVLGRYSNSREALQGVRTSRSLRVEFSTVHRAKGREADYVIVLDLNDSRWGFPSKVEDDPLLDLVLPPVAGGAYPFAEERRLFYVAMTRARIGAYLVTDSARPSTFVRELLRESGDLRQIGTFAPKCPRCNRGRLVVRNGRFSQFWGCTEYWSKPSCRYMKYIETAE